MPPGVTSPGGAGLHVVISCEHGGHVVPDAFAHCFAGQDNLLRTHEGYDLGAQDLAHDIADAVGVSLHDSHMTRLLVELNRSPRHPRLFSRFTKSLPPDDKQHILDVHWHPYRDRVMADIQAGLDAGKKVVHLSIHSFTPVFNDVERNCAFGLLYDPSREDKPTAHRWRDHLHQRLPGYRVRCNYPYTGVQDGFQPWLRRRFAGTDYVAVELETNNKFLVDEAAHQGASLAAKAPSHDDTAAFRAHVAHSVEDLLRTLTR